METNINLNPTIFTHKVRFPGFKASIIRLMEIDIKGRAGNEVGHEKRRIKVSIIKRFIFDKPTTTLYAKWSEQHPMLIGSSSE